MYLTGREQALIADIFKVLADSLPERELRFEVGRRLLDLLCADYLGSCGWDGARVHSCHPYRDSLTPRLQRGTAAEDKRDEPLPPQLLDEAGRVDAPHWGLNLFAWTDGENVGDLRIWRGQQRDNFSDHELALLDLVRPALTVALARARAQADSKEATGEPPEAGFCDAFGRLTRREREVVELVVEGLLDKEIAQRLGISYTTVRTHLDRSFQKLGVSNRSRLARAVRPAGC